jgi:hypothetical protein
MIFIIYRSLNYFLNFLKGRNWAHMIRSYFYDIMLILSKIHHFRIFQFFFTQMTF